MTSLTASVSDDFASSNVHLPCPRSLLILLICAFNSTRARAVGSTAFKPRSESFKIICNFLGRDCFKSFTKLSNFFRFSLLQFIFASRSNTCSHIVSICSPLISSFEYSSNIFFKAECNKASSPASVPFLFKAKIFSLALAYIL